MILRWFRTLRVMSSVMYALMTTYRAEVALWAIATSLPLIMLGVWSEAGRSGQFALNEVQMARYFVAVFIIRQFTVIWVIHEFEWQVVSGRLSPLLLRPIDPSIQYVFSHLAEQVCRLPIVIAMIGLCMLLFPHAFFGDGDVGPWPVSFSSIGLGVLALYAAFLGRFVLQYTFAIGSFWVERIAAAHDLIFLPLVFLSGMVAPLEVFPEPVRQVALATPFPWMVWFPAKLLMGEPVPILRGFLTLAGWGVGLWIVNRWLWRKGLKHYSAMGA